MTRGDKGTEDWALKDKKGKIICTGSLIEMKEEKQKKHLVNAALTLNPRRRRG